MREELRGILSARKLSGARHQENRRAWNVALFVVLSLILLGLERPCPVVAAIRDRSERSRPELSVDPRGISPELSRAWLISRGPKPGASLETWLGVNYWINTTAVWRGFLIIGGDFEQAGSAQADQIAMWDGVQWSSLGGHLSWDGQVYALAVLGDKLIVGGNFTHIGDLPCNGLAVWDGAVWDSLGSGRSGAVNALLVSGDTLFAAGDAMAPGDSTSHIEEYANGAWHTMGAGLNGTVYALAQYQGQLIAGGQFTRSGPTTVRSIAAWTGATWDSLAAGVDSFPGQPYILEQPIVYSLAALGDSLVVGGRFGRAGGLPASCLAVWQGGRWRAFPTQLTEDPTWIYAVAAYGSSVIVGGSFTNYVYSTPDFIAQWDGTAWTGVGGGVNCLYPCGLDGRVLTLGHWDGQLLAGGEFNTAGGLAVGRLAQWDGTSWSAPDQPPPVPEDALWHTFASPARAVDGAVSTACWWNGRLVATGYFTTAGGTPCAHIAQWDGVAWSPLGAGLSATAYTLTTYHGNLVAGGWFTQAGGQAIPYLAQWDGTTWSAVGTGVNAPVACVAVVHDTLFAGGDLRIAGPDGVSSLAYLDGTTWTGMGGIDAPVLSVCTYRDELVVGGQFLRVAGSPVNGLAIRHAGAWSELGGGVTGTGCIGPWDLTGVYELLEWHDMLAVGGTFNYPGIDIVLWNGTSWVNIPSPDLYPSYVEQRSYVFALAAVGDRLFMGGTFNALGGQSANYVAAWDGVAWHPLGSGLAGRTQFNTWVGAIVPGDSSLFVVGDLVTAGQQSSPNIAEWLLATTGVGRIGSSSGDAAPPPLHAELRMGTDERIRFVLPRPGDVSVTLFDVAGRRLSRLAPRRFTSGAHEIRMSSIPGPHSSGIVYVEVRAGSDVARCRGVLLR